MDVLPLLLQIFLLAFLVQAQKSRSGSCSLRTRHKVPMKRSTDAELDEPPRRLRRNSLGTPSVTDEDIFTVFLDIRKYSKDSSYVMTLHNCSGTLITYKHVLTSANCVVDKELECVDQIAMQFRYEGTIYGEKVHFPNDGGYNPKEQSRDIAIVTLKERTNRVRNMGYLKPICLASGTNTYAGETAAVTRWYFHRKSPRYINKRLEKMKIRIISREECKAIPEVLEKDLRPGKLCTHWASTETCSRSYDPLVGFRGTPVFVKEGGRYTQLGLVSYRVGGCGPFIFARVTYFRKWIESIVGPSNIC